MQIIIETDCEKCRFSIVGEMTIYGAAELKQQLWTALQQGPALEINLAEVSELDSAGVQLLCLAKREGALLGKQVYLTGHSNATLEVLDLLQLTAHLGDPVLTTSTTATYPNPVNQRDPSR